VLRELLAENPGIAVCKIVELLCRWSSPCLKDC
jgi:hypothetical protein